MHAFSVVTVGSTQCLDMIVGNVENDLEHGFVKHRLNCLWTTDPVSFIGYWRNLIQTKIVIARNFN